MKKLNKKGFTLIELLAVIVILAIIVVVTVPTVLNSINDARLSSLHSLSKEFANWYDTALAQDQLAMTGQKTLGSAIVPDDGQWHCLSEIKNAEGKSLAEIYGLSSNDVLITSGPLGFNNQTLNSGYAETMKVDINEDGKIMFYPGERGTGSAFGFLCSQIQIVNGRAEVFLIANDDGKFDTNGLSSTYSSSSAPVAYDDYIKLDINGVPVE